MTPPALREHVRQWYPLALVFLAIGLSTSMAFPFQTLFLTTAVHADPVHLTVYLVTAPVSGIVATQIIGRLSDRRPVRRRLLIAAAAAGMTAMALTAFVREYWALLAIVVTLMAVGGSIMSQGFAYARSIMAGSDRAAMTTTTLRMLFSLAWVGGPPLAAVLQTVGGFTVLFATAAGMYAIAAIVTVVRLPEPASAADQLPAPAVRVSRPARRNASARTIACALIAFVVLQGASYVAVQMLPLFLRADLHSGVRQAGLILGLCAGLEIPLMLLFGALSNRTSVRRLVMLGPVFSAGYLLLMATATHSWILFASQLFNAASVAAIQGLGVSYIQDLMPNNPGKASALYTNTFTAGSILAGPLIAGAAKFGYRPAYLIAAGICVAGWVLMAIGGPHRDRDSVEGPPVLDSAAARQTVSSTA